MYKKKERQSKIISTKIFSKEEIRRRSAPWKMFFVVTKIKRKTFIKCGAKQILRNSKNSLRDVRTRQMLKKKTWFCFVFFFDAKSFFIRFLVIARSFYCGARIFTYKRSAVHCLCLYRKKYNNKMQRINDNYFVYFTIGSFLVYDRVEKQQQNSQEET